MDKPIIVYAENVPYFKTGQSSADKWIERARAEIASVDGKVIAEAFGMTNGKSAFALEFTIGGDAFKIIWPVLPVKDAKNTSAAKIQAATALYHDVKARVVSAKFLGTRGAFFNYMVLPNGRTAGETAASEFMALLPDMPLLLTSGR